MLRPAITLACLLPLAALSAEDVVTLNTRTGVTQSYLLSSPEADKARAVAILFPGGFGNTDLQSERGRDTLDHGNFLVRTRRLFATAGVAAAVVDVPSDQSSGMEDYFRLSSAHAEDIERVAADLKTRFPGAPVYL